jgi:hypothetical protein
LFKEKLADYDASADDAKLQLTLSLPLPRRGILFIEKELKEFGLQRSLLFASVKGTPDYAKSYLKTFPHTTPEGCPVYRKNT